jgi:hypothetical protein
LLLGHARLCLLALLLGHPSLRVLPVGAELLLLRHPRLRLLAVRAELLLLSRPRLRVLTIGTQLLLLGHPRLRLLTIDTNLLLLGDARFRVRAVCANLLLLRHPRLRLHLHALRPDLLTLGPHLRCGECLTLHARRCERGAAALDCLRARPAALSCDLVLLSLAAAVRIRLCRGYDRQCGNTRGEKHPGHPNSPFERQNGRSAAPFQR